MSSRRWREHPRGGDVRVRGGHSLPELTKVGRRRSGVALDPRRQSAKINGGHNSFADELSKSYQEVGWVKELDKRYTKAGAVLKTLSPAMFRGRYEAEGLPTFNADSGEVFSPAEMRSLLADVLGSRALGRVARTEIRGGAATAIAAAEQGPDPSKALWALIIAQRHEREAQAAATPRRHAGATSPSSPAGSPPSEPQHAGGAPPKEVAALRRAKRRVNLLASEGPGVASLTISVELPSLPHRPWSRSANRSLQLGNQYLTMNAEQRSERQNLREEEEQKARVNRPAAVAADHSLLPSDEVQQAVLAAKSNDRRAQDRDEFVRQHRAADRRRQGFKLLREPRTEQLVWVKRERSGGGLFGRAVVIPAEEGDLNR